MTNPFAPIYDDLRKPYFSEKKGDGNLANNYPPYDEVTRGDVIAAALNQDQEGGKKKKKTRTESWRDQLGEVFIDKEDSVEKLDVRKGIKNKIDIMPTIKTEQVSGSSIKMKPGSGLGGGVPVYPNGQTPKATGAKLPKLQNASYELTGEIIDETVFDSSFINDTNKAIEKIMEAMCSKCKNGDDENDDENDDESESDDTEQENGQNSNGKGMKPNKKSNDKVASESVMTSAQMQKEKQLKNKYDDSGMKASMKKQYGSEKGEQIYFATIRKKAMESLNPSISHWIDEMSCGSKPTKNKTKLEKVTEEVLKKF